MTEQNGPGNCDVADVLQSYEEDGYVMRYLRSDGRIAWRATPLLLSFWSDLEADAVDDFDELP